MMVGLGASTVLNTRTDQFFNYKGLSDAAIARLEKSVKSSRETLALADKLQLMRDATRSEWKVQTQMRGYSALSRPGWKLDLSV